MDKNSFENKSKKTYGESRMTMYELMHIWKEDEKGVSYQGEDFSPSDIKGMVSVESASCIVGKPKEIIKYLLKKHLPDYKLVKRTRKGRSIKNTSK